MRRHGPPSRGGHAPARPRPIAVPSATVCAGPGARGRVRVQWPPGPGAGGRDDHAHLGPKACASWAILEGSHACADTRRHRRLLRAQSERLFVVPARRAAPRDLTLVAVQGVAVTTLPPAVQQDLKQYRREVQAPYLLEVTFTSQGDLEAYQQHWAAAYVIAVACHD